jgi:hypothetical protein
MMMRRILRLVSAESWMRGIIELLNVSDFCGKLRVESGNN